jgi:hypothetical protein
LAPRGIKVSSRLAPWSTRTNQARARGADQASARLQIAVASIGGSRRGLDLPLCIATLFDKKHPTIQLGARRPSRFHLDNYV